LFWENAANGYFLEASTDTSTQTRPAPKAQWQKLPSRLEDVDSPQPRQPGGSPNRMNLEANQQAQFQRIQREGLLQTRAETRAAQYHRDSEMSMGAICHDPESVIWGTPLNPRRMLGTGTALGVP